MKPQGGRIDVASDHELGPPDDIAFVLEGAPSGENSLATPGIQPDRVGSHEALHLLPIDVLVVPEARRDSPL